jgi:siroheme synthase (precorrin-2 oxidase/ferrochelatase)
MRTTPANPLANQVVLIGTGESAIAALWRLCAAGARIRWYADHADVGEEAVLAHALGGGRVELCFDDPGAAPLGGAAAVVAARGDARDLQIAERARAGAVPVHVAGRPDVSSFTLAELDRAARAAWDRRRSGERALSWLRAVRAQVSAGRRNVTPA